MNNPLTEMVVVVNGDGNVRRSECCKSDTPKQGRECPKEWRSPGEILADQIRSGNGLSMVWGSLASADETVGNAIRLYINQTHQEDRVQWGAFDDAQAVRNGMIRVVKGCMDKFDLGLSRSFRDRLSGLSDEDFGPTLVTRLTEVVFKCHGKWRILITDSSIGLRPLPDSYVFVSSVAEILLHLKAYCHIAATAEGLREILGCHDKYKAGDAEYREKLETVLIFEFFRAIYTLKKLGEKRTEWLVSATNALIKPVH